MSDKLDLRESLEIPKLENSSEAENFQNETLRPILKLQNDFYQSVFLNYASRQKVDLETLSKQKKTLFIEASLQKDSVLKNTFIGMTIGMLTLEELETYFLDTKAYNKRIITMLIERIRSQII
ncbi:glyoxalase [Kaistella polysaccharea]|uniref:glyoxalase n=1 Tax=Kaistella polysaccharea TaxID=2878534 RepID=UPI001CF46569|nr:glyoxalase [Kaistella polysaccharea]